MGASRSMREVQKLIGIASANDVPILLSGETGTGKELVAVYGLGPLTAIEQMPPPV